MVKKYIIYLILIIICFEAQGREYINCKRMIMASMWPEFLQNCQENRTNSVLLKFSYMYEKGIYVSKDCRVAKKYIELINYDSIVDKIKRIEVQLAIEEI